MTVEETPGVVFSTMKPAFRNILTFDFAGVGVLAPENDKILVSISNPPLGAVEPVAVCGLGDGALEVGGVGPDLVLGEPPPADHLQGLHPGKIFGLLLLAAQGFDGVHRQSPLHQQGSRHTGVPAGEFGHDGSHALVRDELAIGRLQEMLVDIELLGPVQNGSGELRLLDERDDVGHHFLVHPAPHLHSQVLHYKYGYIFLFREEIRQAQIVEAGFDEGRLAADLLTDKLESRGHLTSL